MRLRASRAVTVVAALSATPLVAVPGHPPASTPAHAEVAFERLRAITGTWTFTTGAEQGQVSYELVSNGTAILERVSTEEHGEAGMISVIHLEGDRLVLQHYCADGNQPRLVSRGLDGEEIRFAFERAANLASADDGHIHGAAFTFTGPKSFASRWVWRANGTETTSIRRHER
jgi:hypothetical protein